MKKSKTNRRESRKKVTFTLYRPDALEVSVSGDFNDWNPLTHPMKKEEGGIWQKSVFLVPGTYEYKFRVDAKWENDPENAMTCDNAFGTKNNFIRVEKK
jgi:1,4-alpha-glucan branching enzyme